MTPRTLRQIAAAGCSSDAGLTAVLFDALCSPRTGRLALDNALSSGHEDRDLQHQQCQPAAAEPAALAARGKARRRLPAGTEIDRRRFSGCRDRKGRLRRGVARAEDLERRRHPGAQRRAGADPHRTARRPPTTTRRATSKPPSAASSSPASICRTAIRSPDRNSTTSSTGSSGCSRTPRNSSSRTFRWCWPATTTSRRRALDIYPTKSWDKDALIQPKSRAAFKSLVAQGWTDAIRTLHPSKPMFTFWDYKRNRWPRDAGLAARSSAAEPGAGAAPDQGRRRPQDARRGRRQRPRAGVDRVEVGSTYFGAHSNRRPCERRDP